MKVVGKLLLVTALGLAFYHGPLETFAQVSVEAAENAFRTGRYEEAIGLYRRLAQKQPQSSEVARGLVMALSEVGRYQEADDVAARFVTDRGSPPDLWNLLGQVRYAQGRRSEAEHAFLKAIEQGASDVLTARLNLAILRYDRGDVAAAMSEFDAFIDVYNQSSGLSAQDLTAVATAVRYLGVEEPQLFKDALRAYDEAIAADPGDLEPRVRVGELFLEKYQSGEAGASFEEVLRVNPNHPRALLGMARRFRFDGSAEAMTVVRRCLEVNPNLVPARVFLAELLLELERYDDAEREAEAALAVNPASLEALGVLAATRFLRGDQRGFDEARERTFQLNPSYARLYATLADVSARNRLYQQAVEFALQAVKLDPKLWRGHALLGVNQLRVGAIPEGKASLEIAFRGDPYDLWTKNTLDLLDTFSDYEETRTRRFVLLIDGKESELLSLYFSDIAEEAYDRLAEFYGFKPSTPIRVEVYRSHADFSVRTVGLVGLGALGVSFGPVIAMDSPGARQQGEFNWGSTLWHELAHTFHLGLSDHRVPRWFSEGLAVYEERAARPGWGDDVTPGFLRAHQQQRLLPIGELNWGFARPESPEQLSHSYYQASLVCEFIETQAGRQALVQMLEAYREGLSTEAVFRRVLDTELDSFSERFFDYLAERFAKPLAALRPAGPEHGRPADPEEVARRARTDSGDFFAQLGYGRQLFEQGALEEALVHLERAKALFPDYAGPENPYWYLAQIHKRRGAWERAAAELEALTAINERSYRGNLELAEIEERLGDPTAAAAALDRLLYVYPYDMALHARLADLYASLGMWARVVKERRAVLALDPVDRAEALYLLARAYVEAGDLDNARRTVLEALELAPLFERAQELLLEIRGVSRGGQR